MTVYDVNGSELASAFNLNGTAIDTVYDVNGNSISLGGYPLNNVVYYFRTSTQSVGNEINALSDDWDSFIFITDPHGTGNKNNSQAIALWLLANTKASFIVLNGDYSYNAWSKSEYDRFVAPFLASNYVDSIYANIGNHELYGGASSITESKATIYNDFLKDKSNLSGNLESVYYYFDDTTRKVRYIFLNTSDSSGVIMSQTQIDWLTATVQLPTAEWSLVATGHVNIHDMGFANQNESNGSAIISAINTCNGHIVGYFCGHQHIDAIYNTGDFYQATLYCDKLETFNYYEGYSITDRSAGNETEQAVSVISFNTKTGDVVIRRIGVGLQRSLTFNYLGN